MTSLCIASVFVAAIGDVSLALAPLFPARIPLLNSNKHISDNPSAILHAGAPRRRIRFRGKTSSRMRRKILNLVTALFNRQVFITVSFTDPIVSSIDIDIYIL
jgi:hypothetical protein